MSLRDRGGGYGWASIVLHWAAAAVVIQMLYLGSSIAGDRTGAMLRLHTSVAVCTYVLLAVRVVWRVRHGHPRRLPRQGPIAFKVGKTLHGALLAAIAVMLVSGPLLAWSSGVPIRVFDWFVLPSPIRPIPSLAAVMLKVHGGAATVLAVGVGLHILGALKHVAFDGDGAFMRILIPGEPDTDPTAAPSERKNAGRRR